MVPIFEIQKCLLKEVFREILFFDLFLSLCHLIGDLRLLLFSVVEEYISCGQWGVVVCVLSSILGILCFYT